MKIEVLVSTMFQKDYSLIDKMNIKTDAVIINQTDYDVKQEILNDDKKILFISCTDRGLSRSRNMALKNARGDICVIADDDVIYNDNYEKIIKEAYMKYKEADIIAFRVSSTNKERFKRYGRKVKKVGFINSMKISSFEITFKRESLEKTGVRFNELFGAGSKEYSMGEENIFLFDCLRKGLKIIYIPEEIGNVAHDESTWFNGFNQKYFFDKGACFYAMSKMFAIPLIIQFAVRKHALYRKEMSIFNALKFMFKGMNEYKLEINNRK